MAVGHLSQAPSKLWGPQSTHFWALGTKGLFLVMAQGHSIFAPKPLVPVDVLFEHITEHLGSVCAMGPSLACLNPQPVIFFYGKRFCKTSFFSVKQTKMLIFWEESPNFKHHKTGGKKNHYPQKGVFVFNFMMIAKVAIIQKMI